MNLFKNRAAAHDAVRQSALYSIGAGGYIMAIIECEDKRPKEPGARLFSV